MNRMNLWFLWNHGTWIQKWICTHVEQKHLPEWQLEVSINSHAWDGVLSSSDCITLSSMYSISTSEIWINIQINVSINANSNVTAWWIINPNLTIKSLHNQFIWDSLSSSTKINTLNIMIPQARCRLCLALVFLWSSLLVSWGILCCREV